jgi:hypothetical protein
MVKRSLKSVVRVTRNKKGDRLFSNVASTDQQRQPTENAEPDRTIKQTTMRKSTILLCLGIVALAVSGNAQPPSAATESGYGVVGDSVTGASQVHASSDMPTSKLTLDSSDTRLVDVFNWAKTQAMAFVFEGDPVGPWYEAVEPGREGFCMRDTSHQALGAQALGLARHNLNMLRKFAEAVSDAKDWCSYWEIDRYNRPAPVDYKSDAEFWYNLPANFDLLDCCFRMYVWTGDRTYITDPAFLNFYDRTVNDYVERWGLDIGHVMKRPRLMNIRGIFDPEKKFAWARGIPGYNEGEKSYVLGFDVLATQHAAYLAYAHFQEVRGNAQLAQEFLKRASEVNDLVTKTWRNEKDHTFFASLNKEYKLEGRSRAEDLDWGTVRYDDPDAATAQLLDLSHSRLEYPEVSFTKIGTIVSGTMGINLEFTSPLLSAVKGFWVETQLKTLSGLGSKIAWAELRNLPVRANTITVRHEGARKTIVTNQHGPAFLWLATFPGTHETLLVNGRPTKARLNANPDRPTSVVRVTVGAGGSVEVEVPKSP